MTNYQTKPQPIEAIQWTGDNIEEVREFLGKPHFFDTSEKWLSGYPEGYAVYSVDTGMGSWYYIDEGYWIVRWADMHSPDKYMTFDDYTFQQQYEVAPEPDEEEQ